MQRQTVQSRIILETVREMHFHPTADEICARVAEKRPGISRATVYRVLGNLSEEGLILRVAIANAPDRFDFTTYEHAHCLCSECGRVFDLPMDSFPAISGKTDTNGFTVKKVYITAVGVCKDCSNSKPEAV